MKAYADASALVKLALPDVESAALQSDLASCSMLVTSVVGRVEFERAVRRDSSVDRERDIASVRERVPVVPIHNAIVALAGGLHPMSLRSLDALHLATILAIRDDIDVFYCYDERLANAAREHGIDVRSPGAPAR